VFPPLEHATGMLAIAAIAASTENATALRRTEKLILLTP
jgi:hypothetical protein